jgi:hypothetical protein
MLTITENQHVHHETRDSSPRLMADRQVVGADLTPRGQLRQATRAQASHTHARTHTHTHSIRTVTRTRLYLDDT